MTNSVGVDVLPALSHWDRQTRLQEQQPETTFESPNQVRLPLYPPAPHTLPLCTQCHVSPLFFPTSPQLPLLSLLFLATAGVGELPSCSCPSLEKLPMESGSARDNGSRSSRQVSPSCPLPLRSSLPSWERCREGEPTHCRCCPWLSLASSGIPQFYRALFH